MQNKRKKHGIQDGLHLGSPRSRVSPTAAASSPKNNALRKENKTTKNG